MLNLNQDLDKKIIELISSKKLKIPTQPEIALKLREASTDSDLTCLKLAKIIGQDPALTAKFINIANSPLMRGVARFETLPQAINRLGVVFVTNTATGLAMEQLFQSTNEVIDNILYTVWQNSTRVAALAHVYAKFLSSISPDKAALAGLMSHIGVLPLLVYAEEQADVSADRHQLESVIQMHHNKVAQFIFETWKFPEDIVLLPEALHTITEVKSLDLLAILVLAMHHTFNGNNPFISLSPALVESVHVLVPNLENVMGQDEFMPSLTEAEKFYCDKKSA